MTKDLCLSLQPNQSTLKVAGFDFALGKKKVLLIKTTKANLQHSEDNLAPSVSLPKDRRVLWGKAYKFLPT